jgi:hypothetical protein
MTAGRRTEVGGGEAEAVLLLVQLRLCRRLAFDEALVRVEGLDPWRAIERCERSVLLGTGQYP